MEGITGSEFINFHFTLWFDVNTTFVARSENVPVYGEEMFMHVSKQRAAASYLEEEGSLKSTCWTEASCCLDAIAATLAKASAASSAANSFKMFIFFHFFA